jgi:hypothetical protein
MGHNFERDYTKLSICLNEVMSIRWVMDSSPSFGMMSG